MKHEMAIEQLVSEMSEGIAAVTLAETDNQIVPRFNQVKTVAYVDATFTVHADIPEPLKHGIFAKPLSYPAKLRFANASNRNDVKPDIRGLSIRVSEVDGLVLWGEPGFQDFLLNSYPALFVATPEDFLAFIKARRKGKLGQALFFLNPFDPHLQALWLVLKSRKIHLSPLDIRYWSTVPYRLGVGTEQIVKYSVIPCSDYQTTLPVSPGENQLRAALAAHLQQGPGCFHFALQLQADPITMPVDNTSVIWDESVSPFHAVATITIENQAVDNPETLAAGERCSFNPWQCLADHEPIGRMNQVRRLVYANAALVRTNDKR